MVICATLLVAGCDEIGLKSSPTPQVRPASLRVTPPAPVAPSAQSADLARYYAKVQNDLLTRGLLRTEGGGPDTPYSSDDLVRNFENIVFFDEYSRGAGLSRTRTDQSGRLSRWSGPVRIGTEFGATVPQDQRTRDKAQIDRYASRLARITGHAITSVRTGTNFHVFVVGEDDSDFLRGRLQQIVPGIGKAELDLFTNLPRSYYCLVAAVSDTNNPNDYVRAVALIRAEHPDLVRLSCVHEELAQGLGLSNDSPSARPSIFNDDDEFALLTSHDELLLKMLYDPRLKQGMTADEARPVTGKIARDLMGQQL
ncbi:DUF2927 domain-containing protein [Sedimentitalea todarodis]|uniref:DUF2927 domain-containing protein n=1 Tax=Sedimentitalea todarodis TaxID=1631240 RepID=A0ABU3V8P2_9RHOB|nr:DUF2927 domain-containing protein [Sedimentitalea todarodis]MDU9002535.1 DUF2927 domain-containing protein [Sedimentitalea todarodis]